MDENNVLIPQMTKNGPVKQHRHLHVPKFNLILVFASLLLLILSTFVSIPLKHFIIPSAFWSSQNLSFEDYVFAFTIIPQIPIVMFLYSVLRKKLAIGTIAIYILLGLFVVPIFALGGGIKYIAQYGFGYILSYIPAIVFIDKIYDKKDNILNCLKSAILGVLLIHIIGIIYMIIIALFRYSGANFIKMWILSQSGLKIIYDIVFSFVLMLIGKPIHYFIDNLMKK